MSHILDVFMAALHFWVQNSIMTRIFNATTSINVLSVGESVGRKGSPGKLS